jgi:hypothetical protein
MNRRRQTPGRERVIGPNPGGPRGRGPRGPGGSPSFPGVGGDIGDDDGGGGGGSNGGGGSPDPPESDYAEWVDILSCTIDKRTLAPGETTQARVRLRNVTDEERYRMSTVSLDLQLIADGQVIGSVEDHRIGATAINTITFDVAVPEPGRYSPEFRLTNVYAAGGR